MAALSLVVSHSQIAVFARRLDRPFNDWTDAHVDQGFAWRPGSVSFRTVAEGGLHRVQVVVGSYPPSVDDHAVRVIEVPFDVDDAELVVASIPGEEVIAVPPGRYSLRFEAFAPDGNPPAIVLRFLRPATGAFAILRADAELRPPVELVLEAQPA